MYLSFKEFIYFRKNSSTVLPFSCVTLRKLFNWFQSLFSQLQNEVSSNSFGMLVMINGFISLVFLTERLEDGINNLRIIQKHFRGIESRVRREGVSAMKDRLCFLSCVTCCQIFASILTPTEFLTHIVPQSSERGRIKIMKICPEASTSCRSLTLHAAHLGTIYSITYGPSSNISSAP